VSNIVNLSSQKSKGIDVLIFKNAKQLRNDAFLIAKGNKSYSSATSLLILSSEETIKAILVLLHSEGFQVYRIEGAKKFFADHKIRHQLAQLIELTSGIIESVQKYQSPKELKIFKVKNEFWDTLINGFVEIARATKPFIESTIRVKDLEQFNTKKNDGLYFGYKDAILIPCKMINDTSYYQTKEIVDRIFRVYKILKIIYHPSIHNREGQEEIEILRSQLKILIDEGMQGFSLKELNFR
jgi:AbiV family abortive infection protein